MKKFYIIYKDGTEIQGNVECDNSSFIQRMINPVIDHIYTYQIWTEDEPEYLKEFPEWMHLIY